MIQIVHHRHFRVLIDENSSKQNCGGKKKAMLAFGVIQISATVVSAISLAAIALGFVAMKQEMRSETYQSRNLDSTTFMSECFLPRPFGMQGSC